MCDRGRGLFHALLCVVCFVEAQIAAGASGTADVCRATPCNAARDTSEVLGSALHSQRCFSLLAAWPLPLRGGFKGSVSFSFGFMDPSLGHPRPFLVLPSLPRPSFWFSRGRQQLPLAPLGLQERRLVLSMDLQSFGLRPWMPWPCTCTQKAEVLHFGC